MKNKFFGIEKLELTKNKQIGSGKIKIIFQNSET